ncbi:DoxX family protein [Bacteroidota bacterium]
MKPFNDTIHWFDIHNEIAYSMVRIFLGVALFIRGLVLLSDPAAIAELAGPDKLYWWYSYITIVHIIGGAMLTLGFFTRLAAFIQAPILVGAVFFIHFDQGLMAIGQSLELAALVLLLLVVFFLFGSGPYAIDKKMSRTKTG